MLLLARSSLTLRSVIVFHHPLLTAYHRTAAIAIRHLKTNGKQSAALLLARLLLGRRHGNSVFCGEQFAGLYSQRAAKPPQKPAANGVHIRQKAFLLYGIQFAVQRNHTVKVERGSIQAISVRDHVRGAVAGCSVGLAVIGIVLV